MTISPASQDAKALFAPNAIVAAAIAAVMIFILIFSLRTFPLRPKEGAAHTDQSRRQMVFRQENTSIVGVPKNTC
jgi:hypothetical protein